MTEDMSGWLANQLRMVEKAARYERRPISRLIKTRVGGLLSPRPSCPLNPDLGLLL
jgi:hypothetical protein